MTAPSPEALREACERLAAVCPVMARAHDEAGTPVWRTTAPTYLTLARIIAYQQISTAAAATIWARVEACLGAVTPEAVLACPEDTLRACGLSRPKLAHLRAIAAALVDGRLDFARVMAAGPAQARAELLAVKGIGPWTAEVFCLGAKGDLDAFPASDIGLSESWRLLAGQSDRPAPRAFARSGQAWAQLRGVATLLLWHWINTRRARPA